MYNNKMYNNKMYNNKMYNNKMYNIIIFGGGISGLTLAHELLKKKFKILIVEKDNELGGMARSDTKKNLFPSEHSWMGICSIL